ncbi:hypothetical protein B0H17DRAFT_1096420 [Mycena rosella]|uniref:Proteasome assembly chaperone 1 n=1 Tax=Mycena rosella TaxID=1033263 RepID=A0AAD7G1T4_MYCRO|nr:hypothetical protein B0H17DRAFT_1096420 [Mycena rosella]
MDIDPLADTVPPRHAVESDEEEDEYNPLQPQSSIPKPVDVQLVGDLAPVPAAGLLVASGALAKFWARGANLGEQIAAVMVDKIQVGLLFRPSWTKSVVLISEVTTRLPLWAMHPYARAVLDALQPSNVALLDTYAVSAYIAEERTAYSDAPLRYLCTDGPGPAFTSSAQPFAPPNLVQATSAAFLALRAQRSAAATLVLVPAPHIAPPAPRVLEPSSFAHLADDPVAWAPALVRTAHALSFAALAEPGKDAAWTAPAPEKAHPAAQEQRKRPTEFGMYI